MTKLTKKMIANIERLHAMNKEEVFKEYERIYENALPKDAQENKIKLELAYLKYAVIYGREPCEITKDSIRRCFQIEITNEKDQETLSKWIKTTGNATPPAIDTERLDRLCLMYRHVNGSEPAEEIKNKIESFMQLLAMEKMIEEYEKGQANFDGCLS